MLLLVALIVWLVIVAGGAGLLALVALSVALPRVASSRLVVEILE